MPYLLSIPTDPSQLMVTFVFCNAKVHLFLSMDPILRSFNPVHIHKLFVSDPVQHNSPSYACISKVVSF